MQSQRQRGPINMSSKSFVKSASASALPYVPVNPVVLQQEETTVSVSTSTFSRLKSWVTSKFTRKTGNKTESSVSSSVSMSSTSSSSSSAVTSKISATSSVELGHPVPKSVPAPSEVKKTPQVGPAVAALDERVQTALDKLGARLSTVERTTQKENEPLIIEEAEDSEVPDVLIRRALSDVVLTDRGAIFLKAFWFCLFWICFISVFFYGTKTGLCFPNLCCFWTFPVFAAQWSPWWAEVRIFNPEWFLVLLSVYWCCERAYRYTDSHSPDHDNVEYQSWTFDTCRPGCNSDLRHPKYRSVPLIVRDPLVWNVEHAVRLNVLTHFLRQAPVSLFLFPLILARKALQLPDKEELVTKKKVRLVSTVLVRYLKQELGKKEFDDDVYDFLRGKIAQMSWLNLDPTTSVVADTLDYLKDLLEYNDVESGLLPKLSKDGRSTSKLETPNFRTGQFVLGRGTNGRGQ